MCGVDVAGADGAADVVVGVDVYGAAAVCGW